MNHATPFVRIVVNEADGQDPELRSTGDLLCHHDTATTSANEQSAHLLLAVRSQFSDLRALRGDPAHHSDPDDADERQGAIDDDDAVRQVGPLRVGRRYEIARRRLTGLQPRSLQRPRWTDRFAALRAGRHSATRSAGTPNTIRSPYCSAMTYGASRTKRFSICSGDQTLETQQ